MNVNTAMRFYRHAGPAFILLRMRSGKRRGACQVSTRRDETSELLGP